MISGGKNGLILFWNDNGNIVKKMQLFKTPVSNLIISKRPKELENKKSIVHVKKTLCFKAFKKSNLRYLNKFHVYFHKGAKLNRKKKRIL